GLITPLYHFRTAKAQDFPSQSAAPTALPEGEPRSLKKRFLRFGEGDNSLSIFNRFWRHVRQNRAFSQSAAAENASPSRSPPENSAEF
ncbi:MAG: hypothetical protein IJB99_10665, partial [Clostridia bacterium]|nr:hypothetical protein [Clostridia bacterium]